MTPRFDPRQADAINRISGLIIVNAMMFQEVLARSDDRVRPLESFRHDPDFIGSLADHWKYILDEINYFPIFHIARGLLCCVTSDVSAVQALKGLAHRAKLIVGWRAPLRHDLAGRIYHQLLAEAKYLGAYYTSVPAAVLLLKITLDPDNWSCDWSDLKTLSAFRIADLACGTGTLLMAAADVVVDNHLRDSTKQEKKPRLNELHRIVIKDILWGFDVLMSALHLTASTLMLRSSEIKVQETKLHCLPLGGSQQKLGSLEYLDSRTIEVQGSFSDDAQIPQRVPTKKGEKRAAVPLPDLDLCVMNPPFTRSVGGNLLFGNLPKQERQAMQKKLSSLVSRQKLSASITAGLGSVFIALGDMYLKNNGRLALVLPRALLSGVAWEKTRDLINKGYHLEWIIVSHEPDHWNFSDNTELSEVLFIARKRDQKEAKRDERVRCVNLWRQPRNAVEALTVARGVMQEAPPDVLKGQGASEILRGTQKMGEVISVPWSSLKKNMWNFPCAFAQSELIRALFHLLAGKLYLPGTGITRKGELKLCPLGELGELGFDRRDIHDGFRLASSKTTYPALWGHDASKMYTLHQRPNTFLSPLSKSSEGRPLRNANHLWKKAGRLLIAERLRLNTMRLTAVLAKDNVLSNVWWTVVLNKYGVEAEKSLLLWLNSSLGILVLLGHREETQGAWIDFKKPVLGQMPVLDVSAIGARARKKLAHSFDDLSETALLPFPSLADDPVRAKIDEALASTLGLPDFSILRHLLAREPNICLTMSRLRLPEGQQDLL